MLEAPGIWHQRDIAKSEADKIISLDWTAPFPAQWRVDYAAAGGKLTNSWEMIVERQDGQFQRFPMWGTGVGLVPKDRHCWATVLANYIFPCWLDQSGRGFLQPMAKPIRYEGPAIVYPINRLKTTPLEQYAVVDVVKNTLGVGPCQYVLDVEGQGTKNKGIATCGCRDIVVPIYAANQQKEKRARIEKALTDVVIFVKFIRARIGEYSDFGHEMLAYLDEQKKAHPENSEFIAEMETLTKTIDANIAKRRDLIKTPQYVVDLTDEFRQKLLDKEGPEALAECTRIAEAIVVVGGNQDHLVGECRVAVKALRQRAGLAMATNPGAADVAKEIRDRTQKMFATRPSTSFRDIDPIFGGDLRRLLQPMFDMKGVTL